MPKITPILRSTSIGVLVGFIYGAVALGIPGLFIGPLILGITYAAYKIYQKEKIRTQSQN